jgi:hypothetical protein
VVLATRRTNCQSKEGGEVYQGLPTLLRIHKVHLCSASTLQSTDTKPAGCIYVLECEDDHIYVGFTRWPKLRIEAHFLGCGAVFTKTYKPIRVKEILPATDEFDEYKLWRKLAEQFGQKRIGGYNQGLCDQKGFDWPFYRVGLKPKWVKPFDSTGRI